MDIFRKSCLKQKKQLYFIGLAFVYLSSCLRKEGLWVWSLLAFCRVRLTAGFEVILLYLTLYILLIFLLKSRNVLGVDKGVIYVRRGKDDVIILIIYYWSQL